MTTSSSSNFITLMLTADLSIKDKLKYLVLNKDLAHFALLDEKSVQTIKTKITSLLGSTETRLQGFVFLKAYLEECQTLLSPQESVDWSTPCLQAIYGKSIQDRILAAQCLKIIFGASNVYPEIYRMLSGTVVPHFIDHLSKVRVETLDQKSLVAICDLLQTCTQIFRGPCFSRKTIIQQYLLNGLEKLDWPNSDHLALPFALIAFTCNSKQASDFRFWNEFMTNSLYTLNSLYSTIFTSNTADQHLFTQNSLQVWSEVTSKGVHAVRVLDFGKKLSFFSNVVSHLLNQDHDAHVKIPVRLILFTISRLFNHKLENLQKSTANLDQLFTNSIVPLIYQNGFLLLRSLLTSCRQNLALYITEISSLFADLLDATEAKNVELETRSFLQLRADCYETMACWFANVGIFLAGHVKKDWVDRLLNAFFEDVKYKQKTLQLVNTKANKNDRLSLKSFTSHTQASSADVILATASAKCMETFLHTFASVLNVKTVQKLGMFMLTELLELYQSNLPRNQTFFHCPSSRKLMLTILRILSVLIDDSSFTNNSINVFNLALNQDPSTDIQLYARESLAIFDCARSRIGTGSGSYIQPDFGKEIEDETTTKEQSVDVIEKAIEPLNSILETISAVDSSQLVDSNSPQSEILSPITNAVSSKEQQNAQPVNQNNFLSKSVNGKHSNDEATETSCPEAKRKRLENNEQDAEQDWVHIESDLLSDDGNGEEQTPVQESPKNNESGDTNLTHISTQDGKQTLNEADYLSDDSSVDLILTHFNEN